MILSTTLFGAELVYVSRFAADDTVVFADIKKSIMVDKLIKNEEVKVTKIINSKYYEVITARNKKGIVNISEMIIFPEKQILYLKTITPEAIVMQTNGKTIYRTSPDRVYEIENKVEEGDFIYYKTLSGYYVKVGKSSKHYFSSDQNSFKEVSGTGTELLIESVDADTGLITTNSAIIQTKDGGANQ